MNFSRLSSLNKVIVHVHFMLLCPLHA